MFYPALNKMFVFMFLASFISTNLAFDELVIKVEQGRLRGGIMKNYKEEIIHAYLGIPYAKPPVGRLRFKNPLPAESWVGIKHATVMPEYCVQYNLDRELLGKEPVVGVEDCLYLNVYKPAISSSYQRLPILVFIHGGAFLYGGAKDYSPVNILDHDVILVVIQYRLGVLGFISTDERPLTGNYGLKDQQLALEWIYYNIQSFNGDADKVTLLGESAGAASAHYHMLSHGSAKYFHRVIMMSGNALAPWAHSIHHKEFAKQMGEHFNCSLKNGTTAYRNCMQNVDARAIAAYHGSTMVFLTLPNYMLPRVDGSFLKNFPEILTKYQLYNYVDVIIGITADEGARILANTNLTGLISLESKNISEMMMLEKESNSFEIRQDIIKKYQSNVKYFASVEEMQIQMYGDRYLNFAHHLVSSFFMENPKINTYIYEIEYSTISPRNDSFSKIPNIYSSQMENLRLLFNGGGAFPKNFTDVHDIAIKDLVLSFFIDFVQTGRLLKKDEKDNIIWPAAKSSNFQELKIRHMPQVMTYPRYYCEMEVLNIDDFLTSWLSRPLEQSFLLRSDHEEILREFYFGDNNNKCYTSEPKLTERECIDFINSIKKSHWIDETLKDDEIEEWIKTGEWRRYPWARERKQSSGTTIRDHKIEFLVRDEL